MQYGSTRSEHHLLFKVKGDRVVRAVYLARVIRALLLDDDAGIRSYLCELLRSAHPEVEVIGEADNITTGRRLITELKPDLLFLDVEMPGGSGFELLKQLGTWPFEVIFTTGFQRYAIQAIRFSALDYLLKPVQPEELHTSLQRFKDRHPEQEQRTDVQKQFIANLNEPDEKAMKLTLSAGDRTYFISPTEVTHCTADDNYTELHTSDGKRFVSARTLKDYEDMLAPIGFLRVHRSTLVNKAQITHLDDGHVVLKNKVRVEISRRKREEVMKALGS